MHPGEDDPTEQVDRLSAERHVDGRVRLDIREGQRRLAPGPRHVWRAPRPQLLPPLHLYVPY